MTVKNVQVACIHCELPVPVGLIVADREEQFCCGGCEGAYRLIRDNGLESFYDMRDSISGGRSSIWESTEGSAQRFAEFDEPAFEELFVKKMGGTERSVVLAIDGIHCGACVWLIEKLPTIAPGTISATVNWSRGTVSIRWLDHLIKLSRIAAGLQQLGYTACPVAENQSADRHDRENRRHLVRIGIAAAAAGNNMIIAIAFLRALKTNSPYLRCEPPPSAVKLG